MIVFPSLGSSLEVRFLAPPTHTVLFPGRRVTFADAKHGSHLKAHKRGSLF